MISIARGAMSAQGVADYFCAYYSAAGEHEGVFQGEGAKRSGYSGKATRDIIVSLGSGFVHGEAAVQNAGRTGKRGHRSGWDIVLTPPKPYSILECLTDFHAALFELRLRANAEVVRYLEEHAAFARLGHGGTVLERVKLIGVRFGHTTSREEQPNPHEHNFFFNLGLRENGQFAALWSIPLYRHQRAARAIYWASLSQGLRDLGFAVTPLRCGFAIAGISNALVKHFSKRREQILNAMNAHGAHSARAAEIANLETRRGKRQFSFPNLKQRWLDEVHELGISLDQVQRDALAVKPAKDRRPLAELIHDAVETLTKEQNSFIRRELVQVVAEGSIPYGYGAVQIQSAIDALLAKSADIVKVAEQALGACYTTRSVLDQERALLEDTADLSKTYRPAARKKTIDRVLKKQGREPLSEEQRSALTHVTGPEQISAYVGVAGSGKTRTAKSARLVLEREGKKVFGAAVTGVAARQLEGDTGIPSDTLAMRLKQLSETKIDRALYAVKQVIRGRPLKQASNPFKLDRNTVVVLDEAGQASTTQLAELVAHVKRAKAKLILIGATDQLDAIERPGAFSQIVKAIGAAILTESHRQTLKNDDKFHEPDWQRKAAREFAEGRAREALERYVKRGFVKVGEDRRSTLRQLVSEWAVQGAKDPKNNAILVSTNRDARIANKLAQDARKAAKQLTLLHHGVHVAGNEIFNRDRVLFTRKSRSRSLTVENGDFGTVVSVDEERWRLAVKLDRGGIVKVNLRKYQDVRLGYATTVHRRQGATISNVFYLCGSRFQDRSLTHVAVTRAKENTTFYVPRHEAGDDLSVIVKQMQQSRERSLALHKINANHAHHIDCSRDHEGRTYA